MKLAIDSYCYHRQFGDPYPGLQQPPKRRMDVWDFLRRAKQLGVHGVSIESCYLPQIDDDFLSRLRDWLDKAGLERAWAWGHPAGLKSGTDREAARDLVLHLGYARALGASVMRIVGGSRKTRPSSWPQHRRQLVRMLRTLLGPAEDNGVVLAMENHIDLLADEMVTIMEDIDSPWLGVCLDTGNNLRMFEEPGVVAQKLAPWTRATHIKDLTALGDFARNPREFSFWPSVPLGEGLVDLRTILGHLRKARYQGLLNIEVDFLHPKYGEEDRAVAKSVKYLRSLLSELKGR
jgi:sugar phosphate isomerase/epimerase